VAPATSPSPFERGLTDVRAVTVLLEQACGLLRQLVCVTGWLVMRAGPCDPALAENLIRTAHAACRYS
jgi:hypothetical protein